MLFNNFLKNRKSTREFVHKNVEKSVLENLMVLARELEGSDPKNTIKFLLFEDGKKLYKLLEGKGGYHGVMINSPHYIGIQVDHPGENQTILSAIFMEELMTKAAEYQLGTCWVNVKDVPDDIKAKLVEDQGQTIDYLMAVGYPKETSSIVKATSNEGLKDEDLGYLNTLRYSTEKQFSTKASTSSRLAVKEIVYEDEFGKMSEIERLEKRGLHDLFYYVRFAPSNKNHQPWRFILKNDKVLLSIVNPDIEENYVDAGIVMYYFKQMAREMGIKSEWTLLEEQPKQHGDVTYKIIGAFNL